MASPDLSETEVLLGAGTTGPQSKRSRWIAAASLGLVCAVALVAEHTIEPSQGGSKTAVLQDGVSLAANITCSDHGQDCTESKCCTDPSSSCFEKHQHWAMCNDTCSPNMLWENDEWVEKDEKVWTCKDLGNPAAEPPCSANGESCVESKCCEDESMTCYEKHAHWAMCNTTCSPNMLWEGGKWVEKEDKQWTCKDLGNPVEENPCSANGESCAESKCCEDVSMTCYEKHEHWAMCNTTCSPNMLWEGGKWVEKEDKQWTCNDLR